MTNMILCSCTGRDGFTQAGDDYVCARCGLPRRQYEEKVSGGLAYFRGGPLDGKAYEYSTLLSGEAVQLPIAEYKWTQEKITSSLTGRTARVWVWHGAISESSHEPAASSPPLQEGTHHMSQNTTTDGHTNTQLLERRQALKLSRPVVAEKAGITVSQLANMEVSGKRVKEGVMDKVHQALVHFEQQTASRESSTKEEHTS